MVRGVIYGGSWGRVYGPPRIYDFSFFLYKLYLWLNVKQLKCQLRYRCKTNRPTTHTNYSRTIQYYSLKYRVRQKKVAPKVFCCFLSNRLKFFSENLQIYLLNSFTAKCQIKFDLIEKWRSYRFLTWPLSDFSAWKNVQATTPIQYHRWNKSNNAVN